MRSDADSIKAFGLKVFAIPAKQGHDFPQSITTTKHLPLQTGNLKIPNKGGFKLFALSALNVDSMKEK